MSHIIGVITVVYQNYTVLDDFLKSFSKQTDRDFQLFIVDTSPQKKTIESSSLLMHYIHSENNGYAAGINTGLHAAQKENITDFVVINSDTFVTDNFIEQVRLSLQANSLAIFGGKIYYAPGYEYHKSRYSEEQRGKVLWYAGGIIDWNNAYGIHRGVDKYDLGQFNKQEETQFITGCFMAFTQKIIDQVGDWDSSYFLYYEDTDFCERAKRKHIKLIYNPHIVLWHKNAQSTGGSGSLLHKKYQEKNRIRFGLKYAPLRIKLHLLKNMLISK